MVSARASASSRTTRPGPSRWTSPASPAKTCRSTSKAPSCASRPRPEAKRQYKAAYELPQEIDVEATAAKLENGVLTLTLAKKQPVSNARQIEVK